MGSPFVLLRFCAKNLTAEPLKMEPKEVLKAFVAAFNRKDVDGLVALYEPDAINHQVALDPVKGHADLREMFAQGFVAAEMVCIPENIFQDGEWAILEWRDPKGLRGCGFFHVKNGKIAFQRGYWDRLSFQKSHGTATE
jgi:limonene-1,2-epoxide hydrolase